MARRRIAMAGLLALVLLSTTTGVAQPAGRRVQGGGAADTTALRVQMTDLLNATRSGDQARLSSGIRSLLLQQPEAWFRSVFGDRAGAPLGAEYAEQSREIEAELAELFGDVISEGYSEIRISVHSAPDDFEATGLQKDALAAMTAPVPLYSVRFVRPGERSGIHLWSFVSVDGAFRLAGKMRGLPRVAPAAARAGSPEPTVEQLLTSVLRNLLLNQEVHWTTHGRYATSPEELMRNGFRVPEGTTVALVQVTARSYGAIVRRDGASLRCLVFVGERSPFPELTNEGEVRCIAE